MAKKNRRDSFCGDPVVGDDRGGRWAVDLRNECAFSRIARVYVGARAACSSDGSSRAGLTVVSHACSIKLRALSAPPAHADVDDSETALSSDQ